jgi:multidrug transporter EmrE-like cation transporter
MMTTKELSVLEQEIALREAALKLKDGLPHLYGMKYYRWQRRFLNSRRKYNTLVANNQSGKSSINIIKAITWATNKDLWPKLWKKTPTQFWYLYPDYATATAEFETKWMVEFLPRPELKDHPVYGWTKKMRNGDIDYIRFNTGVTIYFKSYAQDVHSLQAGSAYAIFADEEVPWEIISELQMRIAATEGYMHFVFTATRGQEEWRRIVEEKGKLEMWKESEVDILKQQVSAYDCLYYEDGTPSTVWTIKKIEETKRFLHTEAQIQRRIYGRFVKDEGLKYPCFNQSEHFIDHKTLKLSEGHVFAGIDWGGGDNHQSSICLVWTNKDYTYGVAFDIWIGVKGVTTTCGDVVLKFKEMLKEHGLRHQDVQAFYDWGAKDLKTIADRTGLYFQRADKDHATGERILNSIFKMGMFHIMANGDFEVLGKQLSQLTLDEKKKDAFDDGADALRYAVTRIPWTYNDLKDKRPDLPVTNNPRKRHQDTPKKEEITYEEEINEWAEYFEFSSSDDEFGYL